jgi:dihydropteroate synthase
VDGKRSRLVWGDRTLVMGIVNATPDSFTGDGVLAPGGDADRRVHEVISAGADIVDIGGESTRPGFVSVSPEEELSRVLPVLRSTFREGVTVSIDTRKAHVAQAAVMEGAHIINDVSGLQDPDMTSVAAHSGSHLVVLHNAPIDKGLDPVQQVARDLSISIERALRDGVSQAQLIIDPGLGFGKGWRENLAIVRDLKALTALGLPILVGPSRKGTISKVLGVDRDDRLEGSLALVSICIANGADIVRVHDTGEMKRAARMTDALVRGSAQ